MSGKDGEMMKRTGKKIICLLIVITMLLMAGCGKQDGAGSAKGDNRADNDGKQTVMGRYVEAERELPEQLEEAIGIWKMSDGKLAMIGSQGEILVSEDNGASWESNDRQWIREKAANSYIMDVKMSQKGVVGIIYAENSEAESTASESAFSYALKCVLLLPDDSVIPVDFPHEAEGENIDRFWISGTERYFVSTGEGSIYEVREDGSSELYLVTEGSPQMIQFQGSLMIIDGYDFKNPLFYDMEKETFVEDKVLAEFVQENYADRGFNGAGWQNLCLFPGEEDVIYLAGKKGLHRHVIGGAVIEQVIDGRLSRLGNPQYGMMGMVLLGTGEFLAVSDNGKLINFAYDPDKEAMPQEKLKVYSLEKSVDLQAAVSFYQIQNPDVYVEYEVGMEAGGSVTKEDAVKKLNTQIMSGEGPDILMLDGLPMDSYIEKGMLSDLRGLVEHVGKEVFENLLYAFEKEERIYVIPGQVRFPVLVGKESDVSKMKRITDIADGMERMRGNVPGKDLVGLCSEKAIMKICAVMCAQDWKKEDGEIDRKAIASFLTQAKRIYEAQMSGIEEKSVERLREASESHEQYAGEKWMYDLSSYGFYMDYVSGDTNAYIGVSASPHGYIELASISKAKGFEDTVLVPMEGAKGGVFIPETVLGINAATKKKELAEDFLRTFLSKENQCNLSGYAINREALEEALVLKGEENGEYGKVCILYEDGRELSLDFFPPTEDEMIALQGWMETAKMPYIEDMIFEECVFEEGSQFILGQRGIEETLDAIERQLAIYMTE